MTSLDLVNACKRQPRRIRHGSQRHARLPSGKDQRHEIVVRVGRLRAQALIAFRGARKIIHACSLPHPSSYYTVIW